MNRKYVLHPADYAIGESEKLYSDMAAKGWLLKKRGVHLSRFYKAEPERLRYRIELSSLDLLNDESELSDEKLALYEECGWSHVTGRVYIHVFSAPEGSDAPEIYTDPRMQVATLKVLRRRYYFGWIPFFMILILNTFTYTIAINANSAESYFGKLVSQFNMAWVTHTALMSLLATVALWAIYATLRGAVFTAKLHRRLKRGQPIDHSPKKSWRPHRIVSLIMLCFFAASFVLTAVQWSQTKKYDMPFKADGPYLLLKDLGWEGTRTQMFTSGKTSSVKTEHSLLADQWYTYECVSGGVWMYQDIYVLRDKEMAAEVAHLLTADSVFTRDASGFKPVDIAGLDAAYKGNMEYIAVKGNVVYDITYSDPDVYAEQGTQVNLLAKLAEGLKE